MSSVPPRIPSSSAVHAALLDRTTFELIPMKKTAAKVPDLPEGSHVSVTASPVQGPESTLALARVVAAAGHGVVPHLSARTMPDRETLVSIMDQYRTIGVTEVFVVAGDAEEPAGPWFDAIDFLGDLVEVAPWLKRVGFTAYPDGHAFIAAPALSHALHQKQDILADAGIGGYVSTQMCFDADKIISWLGAERSGGFRLPVKLGVPGAVERTKLVTMGMRLGVGASLRYLKKNRGVLGSLLGPRYDPNELVADIVPRAEALGITGIHCFTFNQVASTAEWHQRARQELSALA